AFAQSRNAPAVWLAQQIGVGPGIDTAHDLGLAAPLRPALSTILGAPGVGLPDLPNMFPATASGPRARPHLVAGVVHSEGGAACATSRRRSWSRCAWTRRRWRGRRKDCAAWCGCPGARLTPSTPRASP